MTTIVLASLASKWGPVHVAARDTGVVAAGMLSTEEIFRRDLALRGHHDVIDIEAAPPGPAAAVALRTRDALAAFLEGGDVDLARIPVEIGDRSAWDRLVLEGVRAIPRGATASYGDIARRIGRPGAARAVGGAVGRNPVGLLVPCHRVIAGDGTLGGYGAAAWGGVEAALELKRALLRLEGVEVTRPG